MNAVDPIKYATNQPTNSSVYHWSRSPDFGETMDMECDDNSTTLLASREQGIYCAERGRKGERVSNSRRLFGKARKVVVNG